MYFFALLITAVMAGEITFEIKDRTEQCFMEELKKDQESILEFQVVTGGKLDIDVLFTAPSGKELFTAQRSSYDQHDFIAEEDGVYKVCFSNKFSSLSHKVVYMDWLVELDDTKDLPIEGVYGDGPVTKMDASAENIHSKLKKVRDYQTHHRLREANGRSFAESLFTKVHFWGFIQTLIMVFVSLGHVIVLRSFFSDKPTSGKARART